ncbi:hypothetical protein ABMX66_23180, partial [Vibrio vulnificus]|uniref:hypothetical protein n=1 Tax=Vibrio vulnificus TaxID=672 RepID=UPI0040596024
VDTAEIRKIRHGASGAIKYHISVADPRKGGIHVIRYVQGGSVIKMVATWFHLNQKAITIFAVFLVIGLLYFPLSKLVDGGELVTGLVSGRGYVSTQTGNVGYVRVSLVNSHSHQLIRIGEPSHIYLEKGDMVCLKRLKRLFIGEPEFIFQKAGDCT